MDALPSIISGSTFGAGTLENILQGIQKASYQNKIMALLNDPAKLAAMASKIQQPLNNGLTQAVGNQVQGNLAERGLSQAPGIFAASESQALAPYYQQNQDAALRSVMELLGLPANSFGQPINNSGSLSLLMKSLQPQQSQPQGGGLTYTPDMFSGDNPWINPPPDDSSFSVIPSIYPQGGGS